MSRFNGKQYKGAQKGMKEIRREEAEKRNAATADENRRKNRTAAK